MRRGMELAASYDNIREHRTLPSGPRRADPLVALPHNPASEGPAPPCTENLRFPLQLSPAKAEPAFNLL